MKSTRSLVFCLVLECFLPTVCCSSSSKQTGDVKRRFHTFSNGKFLFEHGLQNIYPTSRTQLDNAKPHRVNPLINVLEEVGSDGMFKFLRRSGFIEVNLGSGFKYLMASFFLGILLDISASSISIDILKSFVVFSHLIFLIFLRGAVRGGPVHGSRLIKNDK